MSAALQLAHVWGQASSVAPGKRNPRKSEGVCDAAAAREADGLESLAFYRRHTEKLLRRYLYASLQVGRAPSLLEDPVGRGWASSRTIRTFEDAMIFVLDVERCLDRLRPFDKLVLCRVVLQEYTYAEAAVLMGMSQRSMATKLPEALDRLTELLLETGLLVVPY